MHHVGVWLSYLRENPEADPVPIVAGIRVTPEQGEGPCHHE